MGQVKCIKPNILFLMIFVKNILNYLYNLTLDVRMVTGRKTSKRGGPYVLNSPLIQGIFEYRLYLQSRRKAGQGLSFDLSSRPSIGYREYCYFENRPEDTFILVW